MSFESDNRSERSPSEIVRAFRAGIVLGAARALRNRLLLALPDEAIALLRPELKQVSLEKGVVCFGQGEPINQVIFPETGVISLLVTTGKGAMMRIAYRRRPRARFDEVSPNEDDRRPLPAVNLPTFHRWYCTGHDFRRSKNRPFRRCKARASAYWLSGYYNGTRGNTVLDIVGLRDFLGLCHRPAERHRTDGAFNHLLWRPIAPREFPVSDPSGFARIVRLRPRAVIGPQLISA